MILKFKTPHALAAPNHDGFTYVSSVTINPATLEVADLKLTQNSLQAVELHPTLVSQIKKTSPAIAWIVVK